MKRMKRSMLALLLAAALLLGVTAAAAPAGEAATAAALAGPTPGYGEEWAVMALARGGAEVPAGAYAVYYASLCGKLRENGGTLSARRYTDYARVVAALSALGADARAVAGYDLTAPLDDSEAVTRQGVNAVAWALLALDSRGYPAAKRQEYVAYLLDAQLADGGWSLSARTGADPDVTAMVLQALAKYQTQSAVQAAVSNGVACLSAMQNDDGSFSSWGVANTESCAQVVLALAELGLSQRDARFVKSGRSALDAMNAFRRADGSYSHDGGEMSRMATEQALCALVASSWTGAGSFFRMEDAPAAALTGGQGLSGRNEAVRAVAVTDTAPAFSDVAQSHENRTAILTLAARGIITGRGAGRFAPDETMTRAEFAAIVVRALGLTPRAGGAFSDVPASAWYAPYVGTAAQFGIVTGRGGGKFDPNGSITRQEAAVMVARAAVLCGMDAAADETALSRYADRAQAAGWAKQSLAFCASQGLLPGSRLEPLRAIRRGEVAQMLYGLLDAAALLD